MSRTPASRVVIVSALLSLVLAPGGAARGDDFSIANAAEFAKAVPGTAKVEKLVGGMKFTEGPVWLDKSPVGGPDGHLVFSDIPADELRMWKPDAKDKAELFRNPSHYANGNTRDREGRLVTAEQGSRSVTRMNHDGKVETVADRFEGKRFNSPNDVVVARDGAVYFTDPPYGVPKGDVRELDFQGVFRVDPATKKVTAVARDVKWPNGLCFSPDGRTLYVANSDSKDAHVKAFDVKPDGSLGDARTFCRIDKGAPDGIRCDADGRLWATAGDGVHVFGPDGQLLGKILVPEPPANLCFGGADGKTLFITARTSLYALTTNVTGTGPGKQAK